MSHPDLRRGAPRRAGLRACSARRWALVAALLACQWLFVVRRAQAQLPGDVVAWGDATYGATTVPAGLAAQLRVAAGAGHTLSLGLDGMVRAWGRNNFGQTTVPATLGACTSVAAGGYHSLALRVDGAVAAWGRNNYLQCDVPAGLAGVAQVAGGGYHSLALRTDGSVAAWGYDFYGQCAVPASLGACRAVAAGLYHSVALRVDGTVAAWGYNTYGQCSVPAGLSQVRAIAAGRDHTVALREDGTLVAWGRNQHGQCTVPAGLGPATTVAAGWYHTTAVLAGGAIAAWGLNDKGQCTQPALLAPSVTIAAGDYHTVVVLGPDCNANGKPDELDIAVHGSEDYDLNTVPDECQTQVLPFCFGDGGGTACPCGTPGASGRGCPNNANVDGARLAGRGLARVAFDNLRLDVQGTPPNAAALYFQGAAALGGTVFGDGLRCASGSVRRLGIVSSVAGASSWPPPGSAASVSGAGAVPAGGGTRHYQAWYRDTSPAYCTDSRFNLTNGVTVTWIP